jgi:hypothetical protein
MADIVNLSDRQEPPPADDSKSEDDWLLRLITEWRIMRHQQQIAWAEHNLLIRWGNKPDRNIPHVDTKCLQRMNEIEGLLSEFTPRTALGACQLLRVAVEILAYEGIDPEATLASGPILQIVRNVTDALGWLCPDLPLSAEAWRWKPSS